MQLIAVRKLELSPTWLHCFTDCTNRRQSAKQNFAVTIKDYGGKLLPTLPSTSIIPENETSETLVDAITSRVAKKAALLSDWKVMHERIFPNRQHEILDDSQLSNGKLSEYGLVTTDTCNSAQKLNRLICEKIEFKVLADGIQLIKDEVQVCSQWCHNYLRNIWIGDTNKCLSKYLNALLGEDLEKLDNNLKISTNFDSVLFTIDK